jgi:hypothetical protein
MKDPARRLERGKYFCPEIITCTHTNTPAQSAAPQENNANG